MKIEDYGFVGNLRSGALVGANGSVDWLCLPRFDSRACLAALLGTEENGDWRIAPVGFSGLAKQRYLPNTLILETTFETKTGVARVLDFMPPWENGHTLARIVEGQQGAVEMQMRLLVRFDYGMTIPWVTRVEGGIQAIAGPDGVRLQSDVELEGKGLATEARFTVSAGQQRCFSLTWFAAFGALPGRVDVTQAFKETEKYWADWASRCAYDGPWREKVTRSLITLKALTYEPTGGIVAAATSSLPEQIGGVRNWDYRFCWIRDATFTLYAMMSAGYTEEAKRWTEWLLKAIAGHSSQLQILYGVAGERLAPEFEAKHLSGYENSRPVRFGNAAAEQFQLDVYGEMMDANHLKRQLGLKTTGDSWRMERHLINFVAKSWREPDEGIWEIRGARRHFTHSKVMAWVALDRGVKAIERFGLEGDLHGWRQARAAVHDDVCQNGYDPKRGVFTQYYGSQQLDASLLMIPLVGFLPIHDARVVRTIDAIQQDLGRDGFVLRYHPDGSAEVDGLPPGEGVFLPCSFWLVDCLSLLGRREEALSLFEKLLGLCNHVGLLSEEYDPDAKRLLGNFPQAFSHVALVNSAFNLSQSRGPARSRGSEH